MRAAPPQVPHAGVAFGYIVIGVIIPAKVRECRLVWTCSRVSKKRIVGQVPERGIANC